MAQIFRVPEYIAWPFLVFATGINWGDIQGFILFVVGLVAGILKIVNYLQSIKERKKRNGKRTDSTNMDK